LCKLVFIREFTRKMLVHIKYFESADARAHEVYTRLSAIQNGFSPLFDAAEVTSILDQGRCPADRRDHMASLITIASHAAGNDWKAKMQRNQDHRTIELYQMIAFFDPEQKAAFIFTSEEILTEIRPIHDSLFPEAEAGYDPLAVPLQFSFSYIILLYLYFQIRTRSPIISRLRQARSHLFGTTGSLKGPIDLTSPPLCSCSSRFPMAPLMPSALFERPTRPRTTSTAGPTWTQRQKRK
jgi:hypothetical protein